MRKLMIVDDDALMCNQIAALADWEQLGIEIVCYALSGQEAMEALAEKEIDLVLTDMNMPGVNGVELIEYISRNYPGIYVVALSGYDDFYFVRNSLKYGAYDYVLKSRLSRETLEKLMKELMEKARMKKDMEVHANLTMEQMTEAFFKRLILRRDFDREQIEHIIQNLAIPFRKDCTAILLVDKKQGAEDEVWQRSVYHLCQQVLKEADFLQMVDADPSFCCAVVSFQKEISQAACLKKLEHWGRTIGESGKRFFNVRLGVSVSELCGDIFRLRQYYQQAKENAECFFYDDRKNLVCAWNVTGRPFAQSQIGAFPELRPMMTRLKQGDRDGVLEELRSFFAEVRMRQGAVAGFQAAAVSWVSKLADRAEEAGISRNYLFGGAVDSYDDYYQIPSLSQWQQLAERMIDRLSQAMAPAAELERCHEHTRAALRIIHTRYGEALSLTETAEELGISVAYLSRIFKEDMEMGFHEYLTKVRVGHVIDLVQSEGGKMKEIAAACGFSNYNYFFRVFKEQTGMTPAQYFSKGNQFL